MTRILVTLNTDILACSWLEDPRPPRELVMLINTGALRLETNFSVDDLPQSACALTELNMIVVTLEPPPVHLSLRLYQALWNVADGRTAQSLADELNIKLRTVYDHYARLKEQFGVETMAQVVIIAREYGLF